ncbi:hypothetical protein [Hufsiella ginkgonis]|uniref:site-specific DNA-methyltransferase (cytosine-N(4)-specific) n=1 Tax=Hufsiella ginkgonis TaxID=2695274 RepID=A0A7K1XTR8_9SPHI|nr:hypothetical protein [Hufsiella ginkgonis]MXV14340.1 hypothetical protein [Hufsiella ginkgonis]
MRLKTIHPFAARMAPEIAFAALDGLNSKATILDPMMGSGTVLRTISELGFKGLGFDIDPLSVLMSKAWTSKINSAQFTKNTVSLAKKALYLNTDSIELPWIDNDNETTKFIKFWFGDNQVKDLRKLSLLINSENGQYSHLFKIALSRLIITKSKGASLAADISHSRPHKVREINDFDVLDEFVRSCGKLTQSIMPEKLLGKVKVVQGDARSLNSVRDKSIDSIITSPPYLNALDYMRGHKLSLVWLGFKVSDLSAIRSNSVGAEKAPEASANLKRAKLLTRNMPELKNLPARRINMVYRYALDLDKILRESARVLKKNRNATFVIGNSSLQGVYVQNTLIAEHAAELNGFRLVERKEREIPPNKRYLPPPVDAIGSNFNGRMRTETVITFRR